MFPCLSTSEIRRAYLNNIMSITHRRAWGYRVEPKIWLNSVTHVLSGLMGCALGCTAGRWEIQTCAGILLLHLVFSKFFIKSSKAGRASRLGARNRKIVHSGKLCCSLMRNSGSSSSLHSVQLVEVVGSYFLLVDYIFCSPYLLYRVTELNVTWIWIKWAELAVIWLYYKILLFQVTFHSVIRYMLSLRLLGKWHFSGFVMVSRNPSP